MTILPDSSTCQIRPRNVEESSVFSMTNTSSTQATAAAAAALAASTPSANGRKPRAVNYPFNGPIPPQDLIHKLSSESFTSLKAMRPSQSSYEKQNVQKSINQGGNSSNKWSSSAVSSSFNDEDITLDDLLKDDPIREYIEKMDTSVIGHNQSLSAANLKQNAQGDMSSKIDDVFRGSTQIDIDNSLQVPQTSSTASDPVYSNSKFTTSNATLVDGSMVPGPLHLRDNSLDISDQIVPATLPQHEMHSAQFSNEPRIYLNSDGFPKQHAVSINDGSNISVQNTNSSTAFSTPDISQLGGAANSLQIDETVLPSPGDSATLPIDGVFHRSFSSSTSASNTSLSSASFIHGSRMFQGPNVCSPNSSAFGLELSPSTSLIGMNSSSPVHQLRHVSSVEKFRKPRKKGTLRRRIRSRVTTGREHRKVLSEKQMATAAAAAATTSNHRNVPCQSNAPAMITAAAANATKRYRAVQKLRDIQKQSNGQIAFMYVKPPVSGGSDGQGPNSMQASLSTSKKETPKSCGDIGQNVIMYSPKKIVNHQFCPLKSISTNELKSIPSGSFRKDSVGSSCSSNLTVKLHSSDSCKKARVPFTDKNPDFASLIGKFPKKDEQPFQPKTYNNINQGLLEFQVNLGSPPGQK